MKLKNGIKCQKLKKNVYRVAVLSGIALTAYSVVSPVLTVIGAAIAAAKYYSKN